MSIVSNETFNGICLHGMTLHPNGDKETIFQTIADDMTVLYHPGLNTGLCRDSDKDLMRQSSWDIEQIEVIVDKFNA
jgi:hypothetical protein